MYIKNYSHGEHIMKLSKLLVAGVFALASFAANAAMISDGSTIGFGGAEDISGNAASGGSIVIGDTTGIAIVTAATGDFLAAGVAPFTTFATFATPITWAPLGALTSPVAGDPVWSLNGTPAGSFTLGSGTVSGTNNLNLEISAVGTLQLFGFDPTPGVFNFTSSGISFSAETSAVPIPAAAWLLGSGLIGLAAIARRKKAAA